MIEHFLSDIFVNILLRGEMAVLGLCKAAKTNKERSIYEVEYIKLDPVRPLKERKKNTAHTYMYIQLHPY